jgi:hypothetical protein
MDPYSPQVYKKKEGWYYIPSSFWVAAPFGPYPSKLIAERRSRYECPKCGAPDMGDWCAECGHED